jgi:hypothetical protein
MRRGAAIAAILGATIAAGGIGWLLLGGDPPRGREAVGGASATPDGPAGRIVAPRAPEGPSRASAADGPGARASGPGLLAAGGGPAERGASADPTIAPAAPPGPAAAAAGAADAQAPISEGEVLAKIAAGEPGFEVLASRIDLGTAQVAPRWEEGDAWIVETYDRRMQAAREVWSGPALWRFHVTRETGFRDRPCFEIVITRADGEEYPPTTLYVTRAGHRLAGMRGTVTQAGKTREVTWAPEDGALESAAGEGVKARFTIVPFDLPPVGAEARVLPPGLAPAPPVIEGAGRHRMPRPEDLVGAGGPLLDVAYESPVDGTTVHQRWARADMRWPVESRTETTWSFRRKEP